MLPPAMTTPTILPGPEVVNDCETPTRHIYCRASALVGVGLGRLIHAAVGTAGSSGGLRTNRSGCTA